MLRANKTIEPAPAGTRSGPLPVEKVPAPAYTCDIAGRITSYNDRAARLWGRRPRLGDDSERYCGAAALRAPNGSPLPRELSPTALALKESRACEGLEAVIVRPDGSLRTVLYYAAPVYDAAGAPSGAAVVLIDVTEREEAQRAARAALQDSEANLRGFFDSIAVGAVQVDADGRFVSVNDRYCEITGYSREELLTMGPFDLDHPDERAADVERVRAAVADPSGIYHAEKRYVRKDGTC
jgi:PAS domain S-box-containing protein